MGMSGAINCLSTEGKWAVVGFSTVSSGERDQTDSQAAHPATAGLGGQEINLDPRSYDPQLSACERTGELEEGQ